MARELGGEGRDEGAGEGVCRAGMWLGSAWGVESLADIAGSSAGQRDPRSAAGEGLGARGSRLYGSRRLQLAGTDPMTAELRAHTGTRPFRRLDRRMWWPVVTFAVVLLVVVAVQTAQVPGGASRPAQPRAAPGPALPRSLAREVRPAAGQDYVPVGQNPYGIAYDPANNTIFAANGRSGNVSVISGATNTVVATIGSLSNPAAGLYANDPDAMSYDPSNDEIYLLDEVSSNLTVINASTYAWSSSIHLGHQPEGICYDASDRDLYVASLNSLNITVISSLNDSRVTNITLPAHSGSGPDGIACAPTIHRVYVANLDGVTSVLSDVNNSLVASLSSGGESQGAAFDPENGLAYVTDLALSDVHILNGTKWAGNISVYGNPIGITYDSANADMYLVTSESMQANQVDQINTSSESVQNEYQVGNTPDGIAVDTLDNTLYTSDELGSNVAVVAAEPLNATNFTARPERMAVDHSADLSVDVAGGVPPYQLNYSGLPPGCQTANLLLLTCTPTEPGEFEVNVTVLDAAQDSVVEFLNLSVLPALASTGLTASPPDLGVGQTTSLAVVVTGGAPPYRLTYAGLPSGCAGANVTPLVCTPASPGTFTVTLTVNDTIGDSVSLSTHLVVSPSWLYPVRFEEAGLPAGQNWSVSLNGTPGSSNNASIVFEMPNESALTFTVGTLAGFVSRPASGSLVVAGQAVDERVTFESTEGQPAPVISSFLVSPASVQLGTQLTLSVSVNGGTNPLTFAYLGLPPGCQSVNASSLTCTPTAAGSYRVSATVTDSVGRFTEANGTATVTAASSPVGSSTSNGGQILGLPATEGYAVIGAAAAALVAVAALVFWRHGRSQPPTT